MVRLKLDEVEPRVLRRRSWVGGGTGSSFDVLAVAEGAACVVVDVLAFVGEGAGLRASQACVVGGARVEGVLVVVTEVFSEGNWKLLFSKGP